MTEIRRRRLQLRPYAGRQASRALVVRDAAFDRLAALRIPEPPAAGPTWVLDSNLQRAITVRWPRHYAWPPTSAWLDPLLHGMRKLVRVDMADIPQPHQGVVFIQFVMYGRSHVIGIDYSDLSGISQAGVNSCELYFKMQFAREGYRWDHIVPGGYPAKNEILYHILGKARQVRAQSRFAHDVYGRFGLEHGAETRERAVSLLSADTRFGFHGGLEPIRYTRSLDEVARSRVCVDMPGKGSFCFRLVDYLAVGSCIVGPPHRTAMPIPLIDGTHLAQCRDDLSDLADLCAHLATHEDQRERLAANARAYFDSYLHREQLSRYYLFHCVRRFGWPTIAGQGDATGA